MMKTKNLVLSLFVGVAVASFAKAEESVESISAAHKSWDADHAAWTKDHARATEILKKVQDHLNKHDAEYKKHLDMMKAHEAKLAKMGKAVDPKFLEEHKLMKAEHEKMKEHHEKMMAKIFELESIYSHHGEAHHEAH